MGTNTDSMRRPAAEEMRPRVYLNGKFYGGAVNGVHRVADRLVRQLDALSEAGEAPSGWDMRLLVPTKNDWSPEFRHIRKVPHPLGHTQLWEQALLPFIAWDGGLVSLANLSPWLHRRKLTMVHDAQFRISPMSYPLKLRIGYRLLVPAGSRTSRAVLTVSDYARDSLETFGFAARERIVVVHNGGDHILEPAADTGLLDQLGVKKGRYCLIFGTTAAYKNVGIVFDAFRSPELADIDLVVIGPDRQSLARKGFVAPDHACFAGSVSDPQLRALYEDALCLLFPSRTEGFGLPPLEAMMCGCPVISAPSGAMPEVCGDAVLYAGSSNISDWIRQIVRLDRSASLRREKSSAGRDRASSFVWSAAGKILASQIDAVCGKSAEASYLSPAGPPRTSAAA